MNSVSHCFENLINRLPLSVNSGLSGFKTSDASKVLILIIACSVDGMNPLDKALIIWYVCNFWCTVLCNEVSSSYWGSNGRVSSPFDFLEPKHEDILGYNDGDSGELEVENWDWRDLESEDNMGIWRIGLLTGSSCIQCRSTPQSCNNCNWLEMVTTWFVFLQLIIMCQNLREQRLPRHLSLLLLFWWFDNKWR